MEYNPPYGISDPDAPYINGDPSIGRMGSIPPASSIEFPQREIVGFITQSGLTPTNDDLRQLSKAVQSGKVIYAVDTGTANAMVASLTPAITVLTPGLTVRIKKIGAKNTGPATLDVGTGVNLIKRASGASLLDNDLPAGIITELIWDGSVWQIANFQGTGVAETNNYYTINIPFAVDSGTVNAMVASFSPAIPAATAGLLVLVKAANRNTGATQLTITGGFGTYPVVRPDGTALQAGDIPLGAVAELIFDGAKWQLNGDLALGSINVYNLVNAPFADVANFSGSGVVYAPYYTKEMTPFTGMSGGSAGNVVLSGGYCYFQVAGRYQILCGTLTASQSGSDPYTGLRSGHIYLNGGFVQIGSGWQSTGGGIYIKEAYGASACVVDVAAGYYLNVAAEQINPGTNAYNLQYSTNVSVARVR
ncbi:hypothetical protein ACVWZM_000806 [Bradyrhizobium sp. USDA 4501]